jgi:Xaa-Pro aminopeptidase
MKPFATRRAKLRERLATNDPSALLVTLPVNVSYLTGFTGDSSFLLLTPERTIFLTDERFRVQLANECPDLDAAIRGHERNTYQLIGAVVGQLGLRDLAVDAAGLTVAQFGWLKEQCGTTNLVPQTGQIEQLRAIKDETELATLREAIRLAEQGFAALRALMRPVDTEKELADLLDGYIKRLGGTGLAFPPIVGVGDRSALPHCPVSDRPVHDAEFLLVDWGALVQQYHSDLTRVLWAPGAKKSPTVESKLRSIYTVVLEAQRRAIAELRPGVDVKVVDRAARGYIADAGYGAYFNHGLGHGIGLEIHEAPSIRSNSNDVLAAGMVVTIEPGIYLPDFGGVRIEDDVLITADGPVVLTSVAKDWDAI